MTTLLPSSRGTTLNGCASKQSTKIEECVLKYIYNNIITSSTLNNPGNISNVYDYISLFTSYLHGAFRAFQYLFSVCPIIKTGQRKRAIEPFPAVLIPHPLVEY